MFFDLSILMIFLYSFLLVLFLYLMLLMKIFLIVLVFGLIRWKLIVIWVVFDIFVFLLYNIEMYGDLVMSELMFLLIVVYRVFNNLFVV